MKKDTITKLPPYTVEHTINTLSQSQCWSIKNTNIPNTWGITRGEGMIAMVIDTGHPKHIDIGNNAIEGKNFTDSKTIIDVQGHQTHCTGIICAKDNNIGVVGVAPDAICISVKALGDNGGGSTKWLEAALKYAIEVKPDVISMSLGTTVDIPSLHQLIKQLYRMNIPIVCAAGNSGNRGVEYPAVYPETISIAAFDKSGRIADFSSKGPGLDFAAPGVDIYSTYLNNSYAKLSGTSMACPWVTGIILLMLSKHKKQTIETGQNDCKTVEDIRQHLLKYTVERGHLNRWGHGIIDAEKMITGNVTPIAKSSSIWVRVKNWFKNLF